MDISITQFRRNLFELVNSALEGNEVWIKHRGARLRIAPEREPGSRLSRVTPLDVINPDASALQDSSMQEEMARAWERDWSTL